MKSLEMLVKFILFLLFFLYSFMFYVSHILSLYFKCLNVCACFLYFIFSFITSSLNCVNVIEYMVSTCC
jgi:hypothetical protein